MAIPFGLAWMSGPAAGVRHVGLATGVTVAYVLACPAAAALVVLLHACGEFERSFGRLLPLLPGTVHAMAMDQRGPGGR